MQLDLTRPTLVITGAWNAAIFSPGWIAKNLFDYPVGAEVPAVQVIGANGDALRQIVYMKNMGLRTDGSRVELYANAGDAEHLANVETYAVKLMTVLPHTPIGSMGINFHFVLPDASDDLLNRLDTKEDIAQHFQVLSTQIKSKLAVDDSYVCNIERAATDDGKLVVDLNYHFEKFGEVADKAQKLQGAISDRLEHAKGLLLALYDLEEYEAAGHDFAEMADHWGA